MQYATGNGIAINYEFLQGGGEKTFLCINSLGTDLGIWKDFAEYVQPHGRVLLFDKRGHGLSEVGESSPTIPDYAEDAAELLDQLRIKKCIVVGLSIGGLIAIELAVRFPDRVEKLVLSNTAPKIGDTDFWKKRIEQIKRAGLADASSDIVHRWFSQIYRDKNPHACQHYQAMLERTQLSGYVNACEAIMKADYRLSISQISAPTLCMGGAEDLAISRDLITDMAMRIPGAQHHILENSGHISCVDQAREYTNRILTFVDLT